MPSALQRAPGVPQAYFAPHRQLPASPTPGRLQHRRDVTLPALQPKDTIATPASKTQTPNAVGQTVTRPDARNSRRAANTCQQRIPIMTTNLMRGIPGIQRISEPERQGRRRRRNPMPLRQRLPAGQRPGHRRRHSKQRHNPVANAESAALGSVSPVPRRATTDTLLLRISHGNRKQVDHRTTHEPPLKRQPAPRRTA